MILPRVVLDSNVYLSGLLFPGVPTEILIAAVGGISFALLISDAIREEVVEKLKGKFGWSDADVDAACQPLWDRLNW